jgi:hypothetical protein
MYILGQSPSPVTPTTPASAVAASHLGKLAAQAQAGSSPGGAMQTPFGKFLDQTAPGAGVSSPAGATDPGSAAALSGFGKFSGAIGQMASQTPDLSSMSPDDLQSLTAGIGSAPSSSMIGNALARFQGRQPPSSDPSTPSTPAAPSPGGSLISQIAGGSPGGGLDLSSILQRLKGLQSPPSSPNAPATPPAPVSLPAGGATPDDPRLAQLSQLRDAASPLMDNGAAY